MLQRSSTPKLALNESGVFELRWREGKVTRRRSLRTSDRAAAERELAAALLGTVPQGDYTVAQAWQLREAETLAHVVDAERIKNCWKALLPVLGDKHVTKLKTADFHAYVATRVAAGRSPATARRELVELGATLKHLATERRLPADKLPSIPLPPSSAARPFFLSEDQVKAVFVTVAKQREADPQYRRLETFLWLGLNTGQRKRAIETLRWDQIDFEERVIHFAKVGEIQTKKRKASVPMREALYLYLKGLSEVKQTEWVLGFPGSVRTGFETLMATLKLDNITPHTLRHTFISHLLIGKEPVFTVSKIVALSVAQIERTYGHLTKAHMRDSLENSIKY